MLTMKYIHRASSSITHKSQHGTREQQRLHKITRNVIARYVINQHASNLHVNSQGLANILAWKVVQSLLPSSQHYNEYLVIEPTRTDCERKLERTG